MPKAEQERVQRYIVPLLGVRVAMRAQAALQGRPQPIAQGQMAVSLPQQSWRPMATAEQQALQPQLLQVEVFWEIARTPSATPPQVVV